MSFEKKTDLNYQRARQSMVEEISSKGISDLRVLEAFLKTPRHMFIDGAFSYWVPPNNLSAICRSENG